MRASTRCTSGTTGGHQVVTAKIGSCSHRGSKRRRTGPWMYTVTTLFLATHHFGVFSRSTMEIVGFGSRSCGGGRTTAPKRARLRILGAQDLVAIRIWTFFAFDTLSNTSALASLAYHRCLGFFFLSHYFYLFIRHGLSIPLRMSIFLCLFNILQEKRL